MPSGPAVIVAGTAATTCCGVGVDALCNAILRGTANDTRSAAIRRFAPSKPPAAARRSVHSDHRLTAYLLAAIEHDLGTLLAGLSDDEREHTGVALGTAYGHLDAYLAYFESGTEQGFRSVNPRHFPHTLPNCGTVSVNDAYAIWGSSTTVATGLAAGFEALAYAIDAIHRGEERIVLAGGFDEINAYNAQAIANRHAAAHANGKPLETTALGEGAGVLLLEGADRASGSARGTRVEMCVVNVATGLNWEADAAVREGQEILLQTLADGNVSASDLTAVFPAGHASEGGDDLDATLMQHLLGRDLPRVEVVPLKPVVGECFAAFGPLQCVAATWHLTPSANDPPGATDEAVALVYNVGYDGTFATALLRRTTA